MLVFNLMLAALAATKEVPSPIDSFSLFPKSSPDSDTGKSLETLVEAGDHFKFTVDESLYFGGKELAADEIDDANKVLFKVVSDGKNTFTCTYTDHVTNFDFFKGDFSIESYINTDGSFTKKESLDISIFGHDLFDFKLSKSVKLTDFDLTKPFKIGKRIALTTESRAKTTSKGQLFPKLQYVYDDYTLGFFDKANILKKLTNLESNQYTSFTGKLLENMYNIVFSKIPKDIVLFFQFRAQIISKESKYCNSFQLEIFDKPGNSGGRKGDKSTLESCLEGGSSDSGAPGGKGKCITPPRPTYIKKITKERPPRPTYIKKTTKECPPHPTNIKKTTKECPPHPTHPHHTRTKSSSAEETSDIVETSSTDPIIEAEASTTLISETSIPVESSGVVGTSSAPEPTIDAEAPTTTAVETSSAPAPESSSESPIVPRTSVESAVVPESSPVPGSFVTESIPAETSFIPKGLPGYGECGEATVTVTTVVPEQHTTATVVTVIEDKTVTITVPCETTSAIAEHTSEPVPVPATVNADETTTTYVTIITTQTVEEKTVTLVVPYDTATKEIKPTPVSTPESPEVPIATSEGPGLSPEAPSLSPEAPGPPESPEAPVHAPESPEAPAATLVSHESPESPESPDAPDAASETPSDASETPSDASGTPSDASETTVDASETPVDTPEVPAPAPQAPGTVLPISVAPSRIPDTPVKSGPEQANGASRATTGSLLLSLLAVLA
ncbi:hypothetical protein LXG23DRAFT_57391 [Yarrowia lipolytica]|nr:hypothetical protein LXG23DRAFT_57391 [Yarrowia lipolytica]